MRSPKLHPEFSARFILAAGAGSSSLPEAGICGLRAMLWRGTGSGFLIYQSPEFGKCRSVTLRQTQQRALKVGGVLALQIYGTCFGPRQRALSAPAAFLSIAASPPRRTSSSLTKEGRKLPSGPSLDDFLEGRPSTSQDFQSDAVQVPYLKGTSFQSLQTGRIYFETYGCQMNVNDMEIVLSIMKTAGYSKIVEKPDDADVIFINTCAIRENAEHKVWHRLNYFKHLKNNWNYNAISSSLQVAGPPKVAVLGCMAERLKERLLEANKMVDVVCGPDAYRDLPRLLAAVGHGQTAVNTLLSLEETYADVTPVRISNCSVSAFVSIMRGCNNMCSYCIVPYTRGRERSRPVESIVREVGKLRDQGVKEVMLLGQNVNSYNDLSGKYMEAGDCNGISENDGLKSAGQVCSWNRSPGFSSICQSKKDGLRFSQLLDCLSASFPEMRFRFTSPHPKDFPDELLFLMSDRPNICKSIHLPAQSGSTRILEKMRRGYTRDAYLSLVERIRTILPDSSLSSDFIAGFCGETEDDHTETLSLIETVSYDMAYMFAYSLRERTHAHRNYNDDVPHSVKQRRLSELIAAFRRTTAPRYLSQLASTQLVLVLGPNKRNPKELMGTSDRGHKVLFPKVPVPYVGSNLPLAVESGKLVALVASGGASDMHNVGKETSNGYVLPKLGDYIEVLITETSLASLRGEPLVCTDISTFFKKQQNTNHGVNSIISR